MEKIKHNSKKKSQREKLGPGISTMRNEQFVVLYWVLIIVFLCCFLKPDDSCYTELIFILKQ